MIWQGDQASWYADVKPDPSSGLGDIIQPDHLLSMTYEEEITQMPHGSISLRDPAHIYSRLLKTGTVLDLSWGWVRQAVGQAFPDVASLGRSIDRIGMRAMVLSPSGGADASGDVTYRCNFMAIDFRGNQQARWWRTGTKYDVVASVMADLGIVNPEINFARQNEPVTSATAVGQQFTTDFQFLVLKSQEWEATFFVGYDRAGNPRAAFIDPWRAVGSQTVKDISGSVDGTVRLEYKVGENPNVLSYQWQDHSGESGTGDSVQAIIVNGQIQLIHRIMGTDTVETWTFRPERVDEAFQEATKANPHQPLTAYLQLFTEGMTATKLEQLRKYFDVTESKTAPQGVGYTIAGTMIGNTCMGQGIQPVFGAGFPDMFSSLDVSVDVYGNAVPMPDVPSRPTKFYCQKATHTVDMNGYMTDFEIVDAYVLSTIGQPLVIPNVFGTIGG